MPQHQSCAGRSASESYHMSAVRIKAGNPDESSFLVPVLSTGSDFISIVNRYFFLIVQREKERERKKENRKKEKKMQSTSSILKKWKIQWTNRITWQRPDYFSCKRKADLTNLEITTDKNVLTCVMKLYEILYSFILMYKRVARKTDMNSNLSIEIYVTVTVAD